MQWLMIRSALLVSVTSTSYYIWIWLAGHLLCAKCQEIKDARRTLGIPIFKHLWVPDLNFLSCLCNSTSKILTLFSKSHYLPIIVKVPTSNECKSSSTQKCFSFCSYSLIFELHCAECCACDICAECDTRNCFHLHQLKGKVSLWSLKIYKFKRRVYKQDLWRHN